MANFSYWPMKGFSQDRCVVGCKFGCKCTAAGHAKKKNGHGGIDINGIPGGTIKDAEVVAVADGKVYKLYNTCNHHDGKACNCGGGWGNYVKIKHDNGYYTVSAHLASVNVKQGETVKAGQVIGKVGRTGSIATRDTINGGYHLHFEVHNEKDARVDPFKSGFGQSSGKPSGETTYPRPTQSVKSGVKGEEVKWVQWSLNKIMNAGLSIDGSCGPKTEEAIKVFQKKYGLTVDGIFGQKSREKMVQLLG